MIRPVLALAAVVLFSYPAEGIHLACEKPSGGTVPCHIWLVPADRGLPVIEAAGGERKAIAPGRYFLRARSDHGVLAAPASVVVTADSGEGKPEADRVHLRPGTRVDVPPSVLGDQGAVHLVSLETGAIETLFLSQRRYSVAPEGRAIAIGIEGPDRPAGITRPFAVPPDGTVLVPPFTPPKKGTGHVVVSWRFPATDGVPTDDLDPVLRRGATLVKPAESRWDHDFLRWAIFYDVPAGEWAAIAGSRLWQAVPSKVRVTDGKTTFLEPATLRRRPALTLRLERAGELAKSPFAVKLFQVAEGECDAKRADAHLVPTLDSDSSTLVAERTGIEDRTRIESLEAGCYVTAYECAGRQTHGFSRLDVDDVEATARLVPITVTGTLRWSGETGPGSLRFTHLNDGTVEDEVGADEEGMFTATVWQPGFFSVRITPADSGPPVTKRLRIPPGAEAMETSFDLPSETFRYRVVDASSDENIGSASACCLPSLEESSSRVEADAEGRISFRISAPSKSGLPPARSPSRLPLKFSAPEYEPETVEVDPVSPPLAETRVRLRKLDETSTFVVRLPGGSPASGASVFLAPPGVASDDVARTVVVNCDAEARCRLGRPYPSGQPLAIVHAQAGITPMTVGEVMRTGSAELLPAAGSLSVRLSRGPESLRRLLSLVVSVNGIDIPVAALQTANVLSGAAAIAGAQRDAGGDPATSLQATLLPRGPIRFSVLALSPETGNPNVLGVRALLPAADAWIPYDGVFEASLP